MSGSVTWVIKSSKKCNLRCKYCYEFEDLDDPFRIQEADFELLFQQTKSISEHFGAVPKYCWHGGEPLLLPPRYYEDAFEAQARVFATSRYRPQNLVQTNLTGVGSAQLRLLSLFDHVSVSLDVVGGLRVAKNGKDSQDVVLRNLSKLRNAGIDTGAISVLTSRNVDLVDDIFRFFNRAEMSFRILPFYRSASSSQAGEYELEPRRLLEAYARLMDLWFTEGVGIEIKPIDDCIRAAIVEISGNHNAHFRYDKLRREYVFVVDTNLDVYSVADTYDSDYCHGNIRRNSYMEILNSDARKRAVLEANERIRQACEACASYGACSGWPMGEATPLERSFDETGNLTCLVVKPLIERAKLWLLSDPDLSRSIASVSVMGEAEYA